MDWRASFRQLRCAFAPSYGYMVRWRNTSISLTVAFTLITFLHIVLGELAPKSFAIGVQKVCRSLLLLRYESSTRFFTQPYGSSIIHPIFSFGYSTSIQHRDPSLRTLRKSFVCC